MLLQLIIIDAVAASWKFYTPGNAPVVAVLSNLVGEIFGRNAVSVILSPGGELQNDSFLVRENFLYSPIFEPL